MSFAVRFLRVISFSRKYGAMILFAGGTLSEDALDGAMKALNDAYWRAKEKNKKYTPKKYRSGGAKK